MGLGLEMGGAPVTGTKPGKLGTKICVCGANERMGLEVWLLIVTIVGKALEEEERGG